MIVLPHAQLNADWNAVSGDAQILNKPTLGTAAATNSTDYATAAQGAKADTAVQPAAIGSTVLAFDSNLQSFINAFTLPTTDGTAGQSLVTNGAGVISFATPAILADPVYIGGVAYFNRSTKPTERSAGLPLVIGDRWYKTDNGTEWFWNGTYWLSNQLFVVQGAVVGQNMTNSFVDSRGDAIVFSDFNSIFVERAQVVWEYTSYSESNYWQFSVQIDRGNVISPLVSYVMLPYTSTSAAGNYELAVNLAYTFTSDYPWGIRLWALKVGSPGNVTYAEGYRYRLISP